MLENSFLNTFSKLVNLDCSKISYKSSLIFTFVELSENKFNNELLKEFLTSKFGKSSS